MLQLISKFLSYLRLTILGVYVCVYTRVHACTLFYVHWRECVPHSMIPGLLSSFAVTNNAGINMSVQTCLSFFLFFCDLYQEVRCWVVIVLWDIFFIRTSIVSHKYCAISDSHQCITSPVLPYPCQLVRFYRF